MCFLNFPNMPETNRPANRMSVLDLPDPERPTVIGTRPSPDPWVVRTLWCALFTICLALNAAAQTPAQNGAASAVVPPAPEDGGPRRWTVEADTGIRMYEAPSTGATIIREIADGAILSNLGCAREEDRVWCTIRPFRGGKRGFVAADFLVPARGPDGSVPTGPDDSKRRARKGAFDARGKGACAQIRGEAMGECTIAVARSDGSDASAVATFSNGFSRTLYFVHGEFISANPTMSGTGKDTDWRLEDGVHFIRVEDQRYELPDALLFVDTAKEGG